MSKPADYQRVDLSVMESAGSKVEAQTHAQPRGVGRFRWAVLPLSVTLCCLQAILTIYASNTASQYLTSTLITVIGVAFLVLLVLAINPVLRVVGGRFVQPLSRVELMAIFASLMVSAGVSTFGLSDVLVPVIAAPWNPEWNTPQRGWDTSLHPTLRPELYITDAQTIRTFREGFGGQPAQDASWGEWSSFYIEVAKQIPWGAWLRPLSVWMIFISGCYGIFWSLSYLVLDRWSQKEKLIFPLAKLPIALLPPEDSPEVGKKRILPTLARQPLFWTGFLFAFLVLAYNAGAVSNMLPIGKINLGMHHKTFSALVEGSYFSGLAHGVSFLVIFTCIGIAFLLPLEISFSVWFYFWAGRLLILVMTKQGYGENFRDFPSDWTWVQNPIATLGMGGILTFSAVTLYHALRDVGQSLRKEKAKLHRQPAVIGLLLSFIVVAGWLTWNQLPVGWAIFVAAFLVLITLGLMRIVAESGLFWIQSNAGFFHLFKMLGLGKFLSPALVAPLLPVYAMLFFDIKTFIAPNVIHAAKMREEVGGSRFRFHVNVVVSLAMSIATAIVFSLVLAYGRGAQQMNRWFYSSGPRHYMEQAARTTNMSYAFEPTTFAWFVIGGVWVVLTFFLRQSIFWFPHPVGFLMNVNPLMQYLWFSFFIGWAVKKIVVKYGGKMTFDLVRQIMLGLIFGELVAIAITGAINLLPLGIQINGIDLNRYGP